MLQALKTYLQSLPFVGVRVQREPESLKINQVAGAKIERSTVDLAYGDVRKAMLVTEVDDSGAERPVALAYVKEDASVTIISLAHLSENE